MTTMKRRALIEDEAVRMAVVDMNVWDEPMTWPQHLTLFEDRLEAWLEHLLSEEE